MSSNETEAADIEAGKVRNKRTALCAGIVPVKDALVGIAASIDNASLVDTYKTRYLTRIAGKYNLAQSKTPKQPTLSIDKDNRTMLVFGDNEGMETIELCIKNIMSFMFIASISTQASEASQTQWSWNVGDRQIACNLMTTDKGKITITFDASSEAKWEKETTGLINNSINAVYCERKGSSVEVFVNGVSEGIQEVLTTTEGQWAEEIGDSSEPKGTDISEGVAKSWGIENMLGEPNTGLAIGDDEESNRKAGTCESSELGQPVWVELVYEKAVKVKKIIIRETLHSGTIRKVQAAEGSEYKTLYTRKVETVEGNRMPTTKEAGGTMAGCNVGKVSDTVITLNEKTPYETNKIKIFMEGLGESDTDVEIDGVQLVGYNSPESSKIKVGYAQDETNSANLDFYGLFIYSRILTDEERLKLFLYTKKVYGV